MFGRPWQLAGACIRSRWTAGDSLYCSCCSIMVSKRRRSGCVAALLSFVIIILGGRIYRVSCHASGGTLGAGCTEPLKVTSLVSWITLTADMYPSTKRDQANSGHTIIRQGVQIVHLQVTVLGCWPAISALALKTESNDWYSTVSLPTAKVIIPHEHISDTIYV